MAENSLLDVNLLQELQKDKEFTAEVTGGLC